jgi:hypothetical protein
MTSGAWQNSTVESFVGDHPPEISPSRQVAQRLVPSREGLIQKLSQFPLESLADPLSALPNFPGKLLILSYQSPIRLLDIISM